MLTKKLLLSFCHYCSISSLKSPVGQASIVEYRRVFLCERVLCCYVDVVVAKRPLKIPSQSFIVVFLHRIFLTRPKRIDDDNKSIWRCSSCWSYRQADEWSSSSYLFSLVRESRVTATLFAQWHFSLFCWVNQPFLRTFNFFFLRSRYTSVWVINPSSPNCLRNNNCKTWSRDYAWLASYLRPIYTM